MIINHKFDKKGGDVITQKGGKVKNCTPGKTFACGSSCFALGRNCNKNLEKPIQESAKKVAKELKDSTKKKGKSLKEKQEKPLLETQSKSTNNSKVDVNNFIRKDEIDKRRKRLIKAINELGQDGEAVINKIEKKHKI